MTLLIAVLVAVTVYVGTDHWVLRPDLLPYTLGWILSPVSGFLPMVLALWLVLEVPRRLVRRIGFRDTAAVEPAGPEAPVQEIAIAPGPEQVAETEEHEPLQIPTGTFREIGAAHQAEMARALGIPWRDELIHDHQGWAVACLEAAQHRAAELRR